MLSSSEALHGILYNNANITALVGTITGGYSAIFNDNPIPESGYGVYPSINHYRSGIQNSQQEWTDVTYVVNCWARTAIGAQVLQEKVAYELADVWGLGFRFMSTMLPVIPIQEDGGSYNAPCEIRVQSNKRIGE